VGLLSLFNMAGRFGWSSLSDLIGRKRTYGIFFTLGPILYLILPYSGHIGSVTLFVICAALILTMYGGGFATIPAYLSDLFGTQYVGAIHGRLLTAWSAAGVAGPVLVNYIRQYRIDHGVPPADSYDLTMYVMACLLVVGFLANLAVRPVPERFYMTDEDLERERLITAAWPVGH
jgi:MFS family permease